MAVRYPPLPSPWDAEARARARRLLQECVYGELPEAGPDDFPMLVAAPEGAGPAPALVALSFSPLDEAARQEETWPLRRLNEQGWAVVLACMNDVEPDDAQASTGRAIAKWAAGLSAMRRRAADDPRFDSGRLFALGHSRLGKAALVAAAFDERFAGVVAIQSGCGGAAPSRTSVGETVADIVRAFPHWFAPAFASYAGREQDLPIDQHWLLALCAPRPLLLCNAEDDLWANPAGQHEMLALAAQALGDRLPPMEKGRTVGGRLAHFFREGGHQVTREDWAAILAWLRGLERA